MRSGAWRRAHFVFAVAALLPGALRAGWERSDQAIAWRADDGTRVWRFNFDPAHGKPFFDPLAVTGGPSLTDFKPADHPWHYALWFSWKYINGVNYWEEDRQSGKAGGATRWSTPVIETTPGGGATIRLQVTYGRAAEPPDLTEARVLRVSAPAADGSYTIDWTARFTAGSGKVLLDRTPMPGEPKGGVNGGYAGLSIRLAGAPLGIEFLASSGAALAFIRDRWRPDAPAVAANFTRDGTAVGGVAIWSNPANNGEAAPWYLINAREFRFICAAVLAPRPREIAPGGQFALHYRIALRPGGWTADSLRAAMAGWRGAGR